MNFNIYILLYLKINLSIIPYYVSPLQAGLFRGAAGIGEGHDGAQGRTGVVRIIKDEVESVGLAVPGHAAVETVEVVGDHRPAVDVIALGILVADLRDLGDGILRVLPGVQVLPDLLVPQIPAFHIIPREGVDVQAGLLLLRVRLGTGGGAEGQGGEEKEYPDDSHTSVFRLKGQYTLFLPNYRRQAGGDGLSARSCGQME